MLTKRQVQQIIRSCDATPYDSDRTFKFEVFCRVCDDLLKDGRITTKQHTTWTNLY